MTRYGQFTGSAGDTILDFSAFHVDNETDVRPSLHTKYHELSLIKCWISDNI